MEEKTEAQKTKRKRRRKDCSLPKLKINVEALLRKAETKNIYITCESEMDGCGYISVEDEGVLVITRDDGYLRIPAENIKLFIEELTWIGENFSRRPR